MPTDLHHLDGQVRDVRALVERHRDELGDALETLEAALAGLQEQHDRTIRGTLEMTRLDRLFEERPLRERLASRPGFPLRSVS